MARSVLDVLTKDSDTDTSSKAESFKNSILEFQLIITLITEHCYLTFTKPLSLTVQLSSSYQRVRRSNSDIIGL